MARPNQEQIAAFQRDGVVCLRGVVAPDWVERLRAGVAENMAAPGPMAQDYTDEDHTGRYFGDYCNWRRFEAFRAFAEGSPAAEIAAALTGATHIRLFHEHVFVKEPGTAEATPWHHDQPYYTAEGAQKVSLWLPLDPVAPEVCPRFVPGSHRWEGLFYPRKFRDGADYDYAGDEFRPVPDIDGDKSMTVAWALEPGDALAFHFRTVHDAPANTTQTRRRAIAFRWLGDDVRWRRRPGTPSPPYPDMGLDLEDGAALPDDWFPVMWPQPQSEPLRETG